MCARTCSHGVGVDFKVPVIIIINYYNYYNIIYPTVILQGNDV
jgi:hypothetical protein